MTSTATHPRDPAPVNEGAPTRKLILLAMAAAIAGGSLPAVYAADASSVRTTMPDICSDRDVTCVLPDGGGARRSVPPARGSTSATTGTTGTTGSAVVVTPPANASGGTSGLRTPGSTGSATTSGAASGTTGDSAGNGSTGAAFGSGAAASSGGGLGSGAAGRR